MTQVLAKPARRFPWEALKASLRQLAVIVGGSPATYSTIFSLLCLWLVSRFARKIKYFLKRRSIGGDTCYICGFLLNPNAANVSCRLPGNEMYRCHLDCALQVFAAGQERAAVRQIPPDFARDVKELVRRCPQVNRRKQAVLRLCCEEERLFDPQAICKPSPAPPPAAFFLDGITELRIASCKLRVVPPDIGKLVKLRTLVLMSNELEGLPEEIGNLHELDQMFLNGNFLQSLPQSISFLPRLREFCVDANRLQEMPDLMSQDLKLITASGNSLESFPRVAGAIERVESYGNLFSDFPWDGINCSSIYTFKVMGNRIKELAPNFIARMESLKFLGLSDNLLANIPDEITSLARLEWLMVYNNRLTSLPHGLIRGKRLTRLMVEGNPLQVDTLTMIMAEIQDSRDIKLVALDDKQADCLCSNYANETEEQTTQWPVCISVGTLIPVEGGGGANRAGGMYLKLMRASQLRRAPGMGVAGMPDGPASPETSPSDLLVVAFAASQGEPEWNGVLREIAGVNHASMALMKMPPPDGPLSAVAGISDNRRFASLWAPRDRLNHTDLTGKDVEDFDVLSVCDARMRWYAEDVPALQAALEGVCKRYKKKLFIGASMGGFAAMLHGSKFADEVIAFGPQSLLAQSILRPPAACLNSLLELSESLQTAIRFGQARGAKIQVHTAADTHLENALALPLEDLALTAHAFMPRTPFARVMERGGVLWTVITAAVAGLQAADPDLASQIPQYPLASPPATAGTIRTCVAHWGGAGTLYRKWVTRPELQELFFGKNSPEIPRPGDWYCVRCQNRNRKEHFFCFDCWDAVHKSGARGYECGSSEGNGCGNVPTLKDPGVAKVPDSKDYPCHGDWGCGACGHAMLGRNKRCTHCGAPQMNPWTVIVGEDRYLE